VENHQQGRLVACVSPCPFDQVRRGYMGSLAASDEEVVESDLKIPLFAQRRANRQKVTTATTSQKMLEGQWRPNRLAVAATLAVQNEMPSAHSQISERNSFLIRRRWGVGSVSVIFPQNPGGLQIR